jgi:molecular chaperone GrpE
VAAAKKGPDAASSKEGAPTPEDVEQLEKMYDSSAALTEILAQGEEAAKSGNLDQESLAALIAEAQAQFESLSSKARAGDEASAKVKPLEEQLKAANDKYLRLNADFDNFRKRTGKEKDQLADQTRGSVVKSLIPLVDSFEAAQNSIKPETENEKKISTAYQGLYKQMVETFKSLGVEAVPGVGQPFDPNFHDAIAREDNDDVPDGTILKEFRRGFRLGNTLLRPAMVQVSASDLPAKPQEQQEEANAIDVEVNEVRE